MIINLYLNPEQIVRAGTVMVNKIFPNAQSLAIAGYLEGKKTR